MSETQSQGLNSSLVAALISQVAVPELVSWLKSRSGTPITDADILAKLEVDEDRGIAIGEAFLTANA